MEEFFIVDKRNKDWFWLYNDVFEMNLDPKTFVVYAYLAYVGDECDEVIISPAEIQQALNLPKEIVDKALRELEEKGMLVVNGQEGEKTVYVLTSNDEWKKEGQR